MFGTKTANIFHWNTVKIEVIMIERESVENTTNIAYDNPIKLNAMSIVEIQGEKCVVRIHNDYLEENVEHRLDRLNQIVSGSYKRRLSQNLIKG